VEQTLLTLPEILALHDKDDIHTTVTNTQLREVSSENKYEKSSVEQTLLTLPENLRSPQPFFQ
jgi:hypothetical protein